MKSKLSPQELKRRHQEKMIKDLVRTSDKWAKEHGIDLKNIPPDEPLTSDKPVVRYYKSKKTGLRYKQTLIATIKGPEAKALSDAHCGLYWSYDPNNQTLRIYEEKMTTPLD